MSPQRRKNCVNKANKAAQTKKMSESGEKVPEKPLGRKLNKLNITPTYIDMYLEFLVSNPIMKAFFKWDSCKMLADRYLIAMVFVYFSRIGFTPAHYTPYNFFTALYLAHDMEEDDQNSKSQLFLWNFGYKWCEEYHQMLNHKNNLWKSMHHHALVTRKCCEMVMALRPGHIIWKRYRLISHGIARHNNSPYCSCHEEDENFGQ